MLHMSALFEIIKSKSFATVLLELSILLTTPKEKVSHVSDTGKLWITSGAIHGNVPTRDMCVVCVRNLDAPKSQI